MVLKRLYLYGFEKGGHTVFVDFFHVGGIYLLCFRPGKYYVCYDFQCPSDLMFCPYEAWG